MNLRNRLQKLQGEREKIKSQLQTVHKQLQQLETDLIEHEQAREIMRQVALLTQQQLQYHISDITSLALESVFERNPYELKAEFVQRRGKTECDLYFVRNEKEIDPLEASGYGAVDVAAFALRIASWSMQMPRNRAVIMMDEPMRNLDEKRLVAASKMVKELSGKLGLQFLIVTHEDALTEEADLPLKVEIKNGISKIIEL